MNTNITPQSHPNNSTTTSTTSTTSTCSICLEQTDQKLNCNHYTCTTCLNQWKKYNSCPICRSKIDKNKPIRKIENHPEIQTHPENLPCSGCGTDIIYNPLLPYHTYIYCNSCGTCLYCSEQCRNNYENN